MNDDAKRLADLINQRNPLIFAATQEEQEVLGLVRDHALAQGLDLRIWTVIDGLRDGLIADQPPTPDTEHPAGALYYLTRQAKSTIVAALDLVTHLKDDRTLRLARQLVQSYANSGSTLILIDHADELPSVLAAESVRFELSLPGDAEIEELVKHTLRVRNRERPIEVSIHKDMFAAIIRNLSGLHRRQIVHIIAETVLDDHRFDGDDLNTVLARKRQALQTDGLLGFVEAPARLDDIAGMRRLKSWLKLREGSLAPDARNFGIDSPRGILLLGVQGAGKSYCAKAIATAWQRPLLSIDVGALYDKYIGESERHLRDALRQAEVMAPVILWVDEIEKAFASAASRSTDGGLSQRMFGALLTWMQEHKAPVFLVATANDIEALPPELLRKGRFDEIFFVDLPTDEVRRDVFAIHLRKRHRDPAKFDLPRLVAASKGFTGSEIEQAVISSLYEAFSLQRDLTTEDILAALMESPPLSVTMAERVADLRAWAKGRCVPAD
jgi:SpoVK/Ycf46/Vps4 family AAA+-type ATPase